MEDEKVIRPKEKTQQVPKPITQVPPSSLIVSKPQELTVPQIIPSYLEPKLIKEQIAATAASKSEQKLAPKGVISGNNYIIQNMKDGEGAIYDMEGERVTHLKRDKSGNLEWENFSEFPKGTYLFKIVENARNQNEPYRVWTFLVTKNV